MIQQTKLDLQGSDVTGQRSMRLRGISLETTVGQVIDDLVEGLNLGQTRAGAGGPQVEARLEREGRNLHRSELVGDALKHEDEIVIHPRVMAGGVRLEGADTE